MQNASLDIPGGKISGRGSRTSRTGGHKRVSKTRGNSSTDTGKYKLNRSGTAKSKNKPKKKSAAKAGANRSLRASEIEPAPPLDTSKKTTSENNSQNLKLPTELEERADDSEARYEKTPAYARYSAEKVRGTADCALWEFFFSW